MNYFSKFILCFLLSLICSPHSLYACMRPVFREEPIKEVLCATVPRLNQFCQDQPDANLTTLYDQAQAFLMTAVKAYAVTDESRHHLLLKSLDYLYYYNKELNSRCLASQTRKSRLLACLQQQDTKDINGQLTEFCCRVNVPQLLTNYIPLRYRSMLDHLAKPCADGMPLSQKMKGLHMKITDSSELQSVFLQRHYIIEGIMNSDKANIPLIKSEESYEFEHALLPKFLGRIGLISLNLDVEHTNGLDPTIGDITSLTHLRLFAPNYIDNLSCVLPQTFSQLINLRSLRLQDFLPNNLALFSSASALTDLRIDVDSQYDFTWVADFNRLLRYLKRQNTMKTLSLTGLWDHYPTTNPVKAVGFILPIFQLTTLTKLDLSGNSFETIPDEIGNLQNLQKLDVSQNELTTLPTSLNKLKNLKSLKIWRNPLTLEPLPDDFLSHQGQLRDLDLDAALVTLPSLSTITTLSELTIYTGIGADDCYYFCSDPAERLEQYTLANFFAKRNEPNFYADFLAG